MGLGKSLAQVNPFKLLALGFGAVIILGTTLLTMSFATANGQPATIVNALFTATSAVCVTGLVVVDTASYWSDFGKLVIILLIQIGGLGFVTVAALFSLMLRKRIFLRQRLVMTESLNQKGVSGIVRLTKKVLVGTLVFEGIGALLLSIVFIKDYGLSEGIAKGIFHSVSAFCNAGFDTIGITNLAPYANNFLLNIVIMALIVIGGLGFFVWSDLYDAIKNKMFNKLSIHTKIVLVMTLILIFGGALLFFAFEYNNNETMGNMSVFEKTMAAFFMSVTSRTAGYATINIANLTTVSKLVCVMLMFIGGSPGSTAGGIKTVTFAVILLSVMCSLKGKQDVNIFNRRITNWAKFRSFAIASLGIVVVIAGMFVLCIFEDAHLEDIALEAVSAFATVGLSAGLTPFLSDISKLTITAMMFMGRVGVFTIGLALMYKGEKAQDKLRYPTERILIG